MNLSGHTWTFWQAFEWRLRPPQPPPSQSWGLDIEDSLAGSLRLTGRLTVASPSQLVILVHGLGGCAESLYMQRFAAYLGHRGVSSLRLNMRGADRSGIDFYHAGLSDDLEHVLASPELRNFDDVYVVGFSLGGHVVLRFGTHADDERLRGVVAICSPLHLDTAAADLDRPGYGLYRRYIFRGLFDMYSAMRPSYELPHTLERVQQAQTIREWDELTVVPRFGFASAEDYYERSSVGPRLQDLKAPALLVATSADPMVSSRSILRGRPEAAQRLQVVWSRRGGHVAFPRRVDLGLGAEPGLEAQVWSWLLRA